MERKRKSPRQAGFRAVLIWLRPEEWKEWRADLEAFSGGKPPKTKRFFLTIWRAWKASQGKRDAVENVEGGESLE